MDPGASTNRTVYTFVGAPEAVVEGALAAARVARQRIDMRAHQGEHPRMGALDVCPFVPVSGVTMDDCVACAREFGRRAAEELGVPVFLYEARRARRAPPDACKQIRAGEYEGLAERIARPEWEPDFGPAAFVPGVGRDRHRRARLPHRLQRQRPGHQGAGPPHRPRRPRAGRGPGEPGRS